VSEVIVKLKKLHAAQKEILEKRKRFNVIKCGRRFGKTELSQELISETILRGEIIGLWTPTYRDLYEVWQHCKHIFHDILTAKDEGVKQMRFITGGKADFWSMEDPDSGRGRKYHRAIIDEAEKAGKFQQAWEQTIRPTLTDYSGDAYLFSTPKIGITYFKEVAKHQEIHDSWQTFIYPTSANPHIDPKEIESARLLLPDAIFRSEYLADDIDAMAENAFAYLYKSITHESTEAIFQPSKQIIIKIDFNLNPFAVTFSHYWRDNNGYHWHTFDEAEIANGSVPAMVDLIKSKYGAYLGAAILTGDAMGNKGDISQRDNATLYQQLLRGLNMNNVQIKVPGNPTHENSRADVNYILANFPDYKINPKTCPNLCRDMRAVQCDAFGEIVKRNRKDLNQRADYLDTERYGINTFLRSWIKEHQNHNRIMPQKNFQSENGNGKILQNGNGVH
jgi:hypothetical protein